ncbi:EboA domain-containing protein [Streptomyces sp. NRAIS4]
MNAPDGFANAATVPLGRLRAAVTRHAGAGSVAWLEAAVEEVAGAPAALPRRFAEAGRRCGRVVLARGAVAVPDPSVGAVPPACLYWTVDDAARTLLLAALCAPPARLADVATELYHGGDAAERRGVLRSLSVIDTADHALPLVADALRTNDLRLIAAALGPYGARHLDGAAWRQAVMKCLHCSIPLRAVADLDARRDAELVGMTRYYARELTTAGRPLPADVTLLLSEPTTIPSRNTGTSCASSTPTSI